jgi:HD superfamily phosphohydrolase
MAPRKRPAVTAKPPRPKAASSTRRAQAPATLNQPDFPGILTHLDLRPFKAVRLAVSGDVALNRLETRLVDTRDFQRLRHLRQLGTACWVWPTALHCRFDHSLGTLAMTQAMIQALRANIQYPEAWRHVPPEQEQLARLLALLHDVTHVPFGHTIEDECRVFPRHDADPARLERFFGPASDMGKILAKGLGPELHGRLMALLRATSERQDGPPEDHYILDMVTGAIGADLLDYLCRDAFFCNLALDADYRFLRHLAILPHQGLRRLAVHLWKDGQAQPRRDVLNELIRLLDNRYLLGERVYYHHAKLVTGAMVAGAVARARRAGELSLEDMLNLGDDVLLWKLEHGADPAARALAQGIASRALWKTVYVRPYQAVVAEQHAHRAEDVFEDLMRRFHRDADARMAEEDRLAGLLGLAPGELLLYCPHHQMAMKSASTLVFWNGSLRALKDCDDDPLIQARLRAILESHQNLWAMRAFLAPGRRAAGVAGAAEVADACDALLAYDPQARARHERAFYGGVLARRLAKMGEASTLSSARRDAVLAQALDGLLALPSLRRDAAAVDRLLAKAVAKPS